jgi:hypothetical protein
LYGFIALQLEQLITFPNVIAVALEPSAKRAFVHRPTKPRYVDFSGHDEESTLELSTIDIWQA